MTVEMSDNPLTILTEEPVPDTRLRAADIVASGRRRARRRRAATVSIAAAVVVVMAVGVAAATSRRQPQPQPAQPTPTPATTCTVTPLPDTDNVNSTVVVLDPAGTYAAAGTNSGTGVVLWEKFGKVTHVSGGAVFFVQAVNTAGVVVGSGRPDVDNVAYKVQDGAVIELPLPSGAVGAQAYGINTYGDIVGEAVLPGNKTRAVLWRHADPLHPQLLATPSGRQSTARKIGDDGRIVGTLDDGAEPYLWKADGTGVTLPTPPGQPGGIAVHITGDWADGPIDYQATTVVDPSSGRRVRTSAPHWARWNLATGTVEPVDVLDISGGAGITSDGRVLLNRGFGPALWSPDGMLMLPKPTGFGSVQLTGMSADGKTFVGTAMTSSSSRTELQRWDC
ncbi:hypothetical protein GCM10010399_66950 [Dactylosporangium fulvum]|uniref:Uncharacterized protein n=1 Tax=Dactylosporangium fulvum TaxID=53359 RepID=A0ABY5W1A8_9ACTN|nr:hypothetical protein [Dactylosporangium fulvum]UWP83059.1 hypothetical protein Dfulv_01750 [Dactylosporangium fulvum]